MKDSFSPQAITLREPTGVYQAGTATIRDSGEADCCLARLTARFPSRPYAQRHPHGHSRHSGRLRHGRGQRGPGADGRGQGLDMGKYSAGPLGWLKYGFVQRPDISETGGQASRLNVDGGVYDSLLLSGRASGPRLGTPQPRGPCRGSAGRLAARDPGRRFPQRRVLPGLWQRRL